jgi:hypothetical protein
MFRRLAGVAMVFFWTGRGFWSVLFPILFSWVLGMLINLGLGPSVLEANAWIYGVAVLAAAGANWVVGRRWNGTIHLRPWDIPGALRFRREHTVFNAPMELWSFPLAIVGVWMIVANLPGMSATP